MQLVSRGVAPTGVMSDHEIIAACSGARPMISPFIEGQVRTNQSTLKRAISFGLSSFGYDARVGTEFKIFSNVFSEVVDPKNFSPRNLVTVQVNEGEFVTVPPNSFCLARTVERFIIPRNVLALCLGKSTYARCGFIVNVTPLEPEWEGYVTLEFSNTTPLPARIYAGEGACQFVFLKGEPCNVSYADRAGKYQGQSDITLPKL